MCNARLSEFAQICGGELIGEDRVFTGLSIDTRSLEAHNLFVALRGPNYNAHDFLNRAQELGASGFVVSEQVHAHVPRVIVKDTRLALGTYASAWRSRFAIPAIVITGSNGKTSTKEMLAAILEVKLATLATRGNMNNDIGLPLTLLKMNSKHQAAVLEIGTNAPGEIEYLAKLAAPTVGLITNAGFAHLEKLGDVAGVAREKGVLLKYLNEQGTAIINADDEFADYWRGVSNAGTTLTFGDSASADFSFSSLSQYVNGASAKLEFSLDTPDGSRQVMVPVAGEHNARNAVAAAAAAFAIGIDLDTIQEGLSKANGIAGRMQIETAACGARIIDDSYNSNPASARAAIQFLTEQKEPGWLVLGDMGELGSNAPDLHAAIGKHARSSGVERVYAVGPLSRAAVAAFGDGAQWFESREALQMALEKDLEPGVNVLIKASRSMQLEHVTQALVQGLDPQASSGEAQCC